MSDFILKRKIPRMKVIRMKELTDERVVHAFVDCWFNTSTTGFERYITDLSNILHLKPETVLTYVINTKKFHQDGIDNFKKKLKIKSIS